MNEFILLHIVDSLVDQNHSHLDDFFRWSPWSPTTTGTSSSETQPSYRCHLIFQMSPSATCFRPQIGRTLTTNIRATCRHWIFCAVTKSHRKISGQLMDSGIFFVR